MSVSTSGPVNIAQLGAALPVSASLAWSGDLTASGTLIWAPNGDITDAQIQSALSSITYQPTALQTAVAALQGLAAQRSQFVTQIQTDAAMFAGTPVGSTITAEHIAAFVRMVNGFETTMGAIVDHLTVSGII